MISSLTLLATAVLSGGDAPPRDSWVIQADAIHTAAGDAIEGGHVLVTDGKIAAVGPGARGGQAVLRAAAVTPGLVDLGGWMNAGSTSTEHGTETPAHLRVDGTLDLFSTRWDAQLRGGVTALLAAPPDDSVIGGMASLLKTGGEPTLEARTVVADACLRGAIGSQPSWRNHPMFGRSAPDHFVRRPTTRMGVEWEWRKTMYDALASANDAERAFPGSAEVLSVINGDKPLMIGAGATQDIRTALFLKHEFGIPRLIVEGAAEAWKELDMVAASGAMVVLPTFTWNGRGHQDGSFHSWSTAAQLAERGVTIALSGNGSTSAESRFALQPAFAQRGGLSFDDALRAVTINPAQMVGADGRIGSIEVGKDADLVLWSGTPFEPTSRVIGVLLDGQLVVDPREGANN